MNSPFSKISFSTPRLMSSSRLCLSDIFLSKAEDNKRKMRLQLIQKKKKKNLIINLKASQQFNPD